MIDFVLFVCSHIHSFTKKVPNEYRFDCFVVHTNISSVLVFPENFVKCAI